MSYGNVVTIQEQCRRIDLLLSGFDNPKNRHILDAVRRIESACNEEMKYYQQEELMEDHKKDYSDVPF